METLFKQAVSDSVTVAKKKRALFSKFRLRSAVTKTRHVRRIPTEIRNRQIDHVRHRRRVYDCQKGKNRFQPSLTQKPWETRTVEIFKLLEAGQKGIFYDHSFPLTKNLYEQDYRITDCSERLQIHMKYYRR